MVFPKIFMLVFVNFCLGFLFGGEVVEHKYTNRLIKENSPYLLQHAHNPVNWFPWGKEAFEAAKRQDKPIFLSIGYSTCHWCHVMEDESFSNERIAGIMNEHFISIKVDREQRADIDSVYMNVVQMMTGSGGWPLSVFLTPDGKPFYGGTYFPPKDRYGRVGFERLLLTIAQSWKDDRTGLLSSAEKISNVLAQTAKPETQQKVSADILQKANAQFSSIFDSKDGGFGLAPKFPQASNLSMLLSYWYRTGDEKTLSMVEKTLDAMSKGGIRDHLGGGFHRYSTDAKWLVPHFEKMLYDQALLAKAYVQGYQVTGKEDFAVVAREIFDYVLTEMTDSKGGFYSAEDADSEGKEGLFYVWQAEEIKSILGAEDAEIFNTYYGVTKKGNFEEGKNILHIAKPLSQAAKEFKRSTDEIKSVLAKGRTKLFAQRAKRIRPRRDDKIIVGWNGLMVSALAYGGKVLDDKRYVAAAEKCADFLLERLKQNGRLMRYYRDGQVSGLGFLDDYAFLIAGLLDLYEATYDSRWLVEAKKLTEEMLGLFGDDEGGFFLSGKDGEKLLVRNKPGYDGAVPSGNSIAVQVLVKLGHLTMQHRFTDKAQSVIDGFANQINQSPTSLSAMLIGVDFLLGSSREIVIAGNRRWPQTKKMLQLVKTKFLPNAVVVFNEEGGGEGLKGIVSFVKYQKAINGKATAYVCENYVCKRPVNTVGELKKLLEKVRKSQ